MSTSMTAFFLWLMTFFGAGPDLPHCGPTGGQCGTQAAPPSPPPPPPPPAPPSGRVLSDISNGF